MSRFRFVVGLLLGVSLPLVAGEIYARARPPANLQQYLGDRSPMSGIYRPDPALRVAYVSPAAFRQQYDDRLRQLGSLSSSQPTWAWFGNSFVQADGMLGDTAQAGLPHRRMFFLQRNEPLAVRVAQIRMLLEQGLRPQRIFFVLLPIDIEDIGKWPISSIFVNRSGAITYRVSKPPALLDALIEESDLALLAWVRSGGRYPNPSYRRDQVLTDLPPVTRADLAGMCAILGELSRRFDVPVTIVLLPNRAQVFGTMGYHLQDAVAGIARQAGLEVFDARSAFDGVANRRDLFLPDWHFNPEGNRLLLHAILGHLARIGTPPSR